MNATTTVALKDHLRARQHEVDARLEALMPAADQQPAVLHRAMRHSMFAGGKRIRPALCLESAAVIDPSAPESALDIACGLEMIHTYSLIHDDLPALDNDDFRRGQPTCHKAFGEATAILAGDALLTLAFELLGRSGNSTVVVEVARAAGTAGGMIAGQMFDLEYERKPATADIVEMVHRAKTGAMLLAAVRAGAIAAGATADHLALLSNYGRHIGLAFQIVDDILDVESSTAQLGKTAGKDAAQQKATYPAVHGVERSRQLAEREVRDALESIVSFGERAHWLREIALYLGSRKN